MRTRSLAHGFAMLLAAALLTHASGLCAQATAVAPKSRPPLGEALVGQPARDYQAALLLFDDADYAGASIKFKRAFEQSNDARLLWNIAVCEKNLRHYVAVLALLERYQRLESELSAAERGEAAAVQNAVRALVSRVRVRTTQPQIEISVDGAPRGQTPLMEPLFVDLGKHSFRFTKPGFQDRVIVQELAGGSETTLDISLDPTPHTGRLHVIAQGGDRIHVDGKLMGEASFQGALPPGEHTLRVTRQGRRDFERAVSIVAGETRTQYVSLERESTGVPTWLWVGAGALVLGGLATGGYFLLRPSDNPEPVLGTIDTQALR